LMILSVGRPERVEVHPKTFVMIGVEDRLEVFVELLLVVFVVMSIEREGGVFERK
jgi:hypothetical protein